LQRAICLGQKSAALSCTIDCNVLLFFLILMASICIPVCVLSHVPLFHRDLDIALLRRLEKRILVPLPNEKARGLMLRGHLTDGWPEGRARGLDYPDLARKTEGYSGSDISLLCKEAAMRPVRRLMKQLLAVPTPQSAAAQASQAELAEEVRLDPVTSEDVRSALACTRPSAQSKFLEKYAQWHADYGAGIRDVALEAQERDS
jgi:katanin p60 ATPase-containing subunit A1